MARDNTGRLCARCERHARDRLIAPPQVPPEFWQTEAFREAFAGRHMGRIARAYRMHPYHRAVYGPSGISQSLLGQWLGLRQPLVSRYENGPPLQHLDTLQHWARVLRIPPELLWFRMPEDATPLATSDPTPDGHRTSIPNKLVPLPPGPGGEPADDPVLVAAWNHRGTVEAVVVLSGGVPVKRRAFLSLTGPILTAPAHQWLLHEPQAVVSGLNGHRVSTSVVTRLPAMISELRALDDEAGGGDVLAAAEFHVGWVADLLDQASYDEATGRALHRALAEFGQLAGWSCYDTGQHGLAQRYNIAALRAAHAADDRPLGAHILGEMAYQAAHQDQPTDAVTLIDTAVVGTRNQQTPRLLAQLYIQQAHAFAALHDASACTAAISKARAAVEQSPRDDDPQYLYWVRPAEITASAGECLLQLGHPDQAATLISQGIALFDAPFDRDRQYYLTHLVESLARPGKQRDLDAAAGIAMEALQLAENLSSTLNVDRIRLLTRQLNPHAKLPAVQEFLDRAKVFLAGSR